MSEESFIREVNEEIRQERLHALWGRYGPILIGLAIFLVLLTGAYQAYSYWQSKKAAAIGDNFISALQLAQQGDQKEALKKLEELRQTGVGNYPALALFRMAGLKEQAGDSKGAVELLDSIASDSHGTELLKKLASLRAAYILIDKGSFEDVKARLEPLLKDKGPIVALANEALGLSAWKNGDVANARVYLQKAKEIPWQGFGSSTRAQMLLDVLQSKAADSFSKPADSSKEASVKQAPVAGKGKEISKPKSH